MAEITEAQITEAQALIVLPLSHMKTELRIPAAEPSHDDLLTAQIVSAVSYTARITGATGNALLPLRAAAVAVVRDLYDGYREIRPDSAAFALLAPFRRYR